MADPTLGRKRRYAGAFARTQQPCLIFPSLSDRGFQADCFALFARWSALSGGAHAAAVQAEQAALRRCFALGARDGMRAIGLVVRGDLAGYCITERLGNRFCLGHFIKTDHAYAGCTDYLLRHAAIVHAEAGDRFINFEQDLGLPGLRRWKESWHPVGFLRKYAIASPADCPGAPTCLTPRGDHLPHRGDGRTLPHA